MLTAHCLSWVETNLDWIIRCPQNARQLHSPYCKQNPTLPPTLICTKLLNSCSKISYCQSSFLLNGILAALLLPPILLISYITIEALLRKKHRRKNCPNSGSLSTLTTNWTRIFQILEEKAAENVHNNIPWTESATLYQWIFKRNSKQKPH